MDMIVLILCCMRKSFLRAVIQMDWLWFRRTFRAFSVAICGMVSKHACKSCGSIQDATHIKFQFPAMQQHGGLQNSTEMHFVFSMVYLIDACVCVGMHAHSDAHANHVCMPMSLHAEPLACESYVCGRSCTLCFLPRHAS